MKLYTPIYHNYGNIAVTTRGQIVHSVLLYITPGGSFRIKSL